MTFEYAVRCVSSQPPKPAASQTPQRGSVNSGKQWRNSEKFYGAWPSGKGPDLRSTGRAGSNPGRRAAECNPGQVVYTRASVAKQYTLVPANGRRCSAAEEVTAGLVESNGSLPPGLWIPSRAG